MRKLILLFVVTVTFISCTGPSGPPGLNGFDGLDGQNIVAQSYEITRNFTAPDYRFRVTHPNLPEPILETDMILVYILWDEVPATDGGTIDVWRLVPQTVYSDFGEFTYNYESTFIDVDIFLDGPASTDFNFLAPADIDNQTFRVVILPVDLASDPTLDITDYNSVMNVGGITKTDIIVVE